ncbi:Protein roadkill [Orchesella cincta]|uniref:Protein roadkill n=1 Tax=Orchesella cincta TaxID=48709 RepID=A0A1D2MAI5_ORCCI|nr:Protein roadkill [Orchesella cincta]
MKHKVGPGGMTHYIPSAELRNAAFRDSFARDFGKLFKNSIGADVTISTGKTKFQAHTLILKARSSVFAAMFNTNMIENETKSLVISDFDDVVVKGMLEYLYTGKLIEDCGYALADSLNKDNAPMIWSLANALNVPFLILRTQDFAYLNKVDLTAFQATHSSSFIKMKVPSARGDLADLFRPIIP